MCTYFFSIISSYLVIDFSFYNFCFYIRGLGQSDSEHSVISDIISGNNYWVREQIRAAFKQSGFAHESVDRYKLLPCEFGTYVNTSAETIKCIECPAGKFIRSLWKLHNYIVGIICLHCQSALCSLRFKGTYMQYQMACVYSWNTKVSI